MTMINPPELAGAVFPVWCPLCEAGCPRADHPGDGTLYDTTKFCGGCLKGGEPARIASLEALEMLDTPREVFFDTVTEKMKSIFEVPASHMVLVDPSRCWFKSWTGKWCEFEDNGVVQCDRELGWCNYILVPTFHETLVIEDAQIDARTSLNAFVTGPPYFRFYAGAPLIGSQGERYGTLCVVDFVPRAFTAQHYALLNNFASLCVEELERNKRLRDKLHERTINCAWSSRQLDLSLNAVQEGVVMLDMRDSSWPITYSNPQFQVASGLSSDVLETAHFWDLFDNPGRPIDDIGLRVGSGRMFNMQVAFRQSPQFMTFRFLPATSHAFAPSKPAGTPPWAPFASTSNIGSMSGISSDGFTPEHKDNDYIVDNVKCFWFAIVLPNDALAESSMLSRSSSFTSERGHDSELELPSELGIEDLGPLLGTGSFGKVFRCSLKDGSRVVVKMIDLRRFNKEPEHVKAQLREAQLSSLLIHPNIASVLSYATSGDTCIDTLWLVSKLCDMGTLSNACEKGWLRLERKLTSPVDMTAVLLALRDVACAIAYVHKKGVIHSDLTGRNILLASTDSEERRSGFVAKVCDFGMAQYTNGASLKTSSLGTINHMPPELLSQNILNQAADVWAFGVVAWEAYHGKCAYQGKDPTHIVVAVVMNKLCLPWPEDEAEGYFSLAKQCLMHEHTERPSFVALLEMLDTLLSI